MKCRIDVRELWPVYEVVLDKAGDFDIGEEKLERWQKAVDAFERAQDQIRTLLEAKYPSEPEKPLPERHPTRQVIDYAGPGCGREAAKLTAKNGVFIVTTKETIP